jgi:tetratricopeptide (TPR) repeat protein
MTTRTTTQRRSLRVRGGHGLLACLLALPLLLATAGHVRAEPASDPKLTEFGQKLAAAINARNLTILEALIDVRALAGRVAELVLDDPDARRGFVDGFVRQSGSSILTHDFAMLDRANATVKMMGVVERDGERRPLLRFDMPDNGFAYVEYVVERREKNVIRAVDWYALANGELTSVAAAGLTQLIASPTPKLLRILLGAGEVERSVVDAFVASSRFTREGKPAEALALLETLPPKLASSRFILRRRIALANLSGDDARYFELLEQLARDYGDEPSAAFLLLDHYFTQGDRTAILRSIAAIEARVGRDGMILLLTANAHYIDGAHEEALRLATEAIEREPDLEAPYFTLASAYTMRSDFAKAVDAYKQLETRFGYAFSRDDFADDPSNAGLLSSAPFLAWKSQQR